MLLCRKKDLVCLLGTKHDHIVKLSQLTKRSDLSVPFSFDSNEESLEY